MCDRCDNRRLKVFIKLQYPCEECFHGEKSWLDEILPPNKEKFEMEKKYHIMKNIEILKDSLEKECEKINIRVSTDILYHGSESQFTRVFITFFLKLSNFRFFRRIFKMV